MDAARVILDILDDCAASFTFPALDNGYVYLAASRLSLFRSADDWALVTEVFGFSPREGSPSIAIQTFARDPHQAYRYVLPLGEIDWEDEERVAEGVRDVTLRGRRVELPSRAEYARHGIELIEPDRVQVFEVCRWLAAVARDDVLATPDERRAGVRPQTTELLVLDEWHHPDVIGGEPPSAVETFRQLANVLETGDLSRYAPPEPPNTHWKNWPEGGTL